MSKIVFLARKELYHILRDSRSLIIVFVMPLMMTFLYGYAINMDIENIKIAVIDFDHTFDSRQLTGAFYNSNYFSPPESEFDATDPESLLRSNKASAILVIRPGFAKAFARREQFDLGMIIDGSDAQLAAAVQGYSEALLAGFLEDRLLPGQTLPGIRISTQVKYNPDLQSSHFFVPGLVAVILMMISALLTSITIAREKESGTMEQLLTAPVKPHQILIGKISPYVIIAFLDGILVLVFARLVFNVPMTGSYLLLLGFGFIYVATALSLGILVSAISKTQQVAMMIALTSTLLPSVMLSGFIFAIKNMPLPLQVISHIIPARYFVVIIRGIMLKEAGLDILAVQGLFLIGLMIVLLFIAAKNFKTTIG